MRSFHPLSGGMNIKSGTLFPKLTFASRLINAALPLTQGAFDEAM
jgi:hypothetical protein